MTVLVSPAYPSHIINQDQALDLLSSYLIALRQSKI